MRIYSASGLLTRVIDRNANAIVLEYDSSGFLSRITGAHGRSVTLTKGPSGRVAAVTDPANRVFRFVYDSNGMLSSVVDALGASRAFTYTSGLVDAAVGGVTSPRPLARLSAITDSRGNVQTRLTYDSKGRVATWTDRQEVWSFSYNTSSNRTTKRDSVGNTWTFEYSSNGNVTRSQDPAGRVESFTLDASNNVTQTVDKLGRRMTYTYDSLGNRTTVTDPLGGTRSLSYNTTFSKVTSISDTRGITTRFEYDPRGNLIRKVDALNGQTQMSYDAKGQLLAVTTPMGNRTRFDYDSNGYVIRTIDAKGDISAESHDALGRIVASTDGEGLVTRRRYDDANRLLEVVDPAGAMTRYEYDSVGNMTAVVLATGGRYVMQYDSFNRLTASTDPNSRTTTFTYDRRGNVSSKRDPRGQTTSYVYDIYDRLVRINKPDPDTVSIAYDAGGNVTSISDGDSSLAYTYDAMDRVISVQAGASAVQPASTLSYSYDAEGNRVRLADSSGGTVDYQYDALSRVSRLDAGAGASFVFSYDSDSRRTSVQRGAFASTLYRYDEADQVTAIEHQGGPSQLSLTYAYDRVGRATRKTDPAGLHTYSYDGAGRVSAVAHPVAEQPAESYSHDGVGNRLASHRQTAQVVDRANQMTSDSQHTYEYDANGNLARKIERATGATTSFAWNSDDQLIRVTMPDGRVITFAYDALGRRISRSVGTSRTSWAYDEEERFLEFRNGVFSARVLSGPSVDEILAVVPSSTSPVFVRSDAQGTVLQEISPSGAETARQSYDSFGRVVSSTGVMQSASGLHGREFDSDTGLYYFRNRYFDPNTGRFLSEDPIGFEGSINFYEFALGNPVNRVDPFGLAPSGDPVPGAPNYRYRMDMNQHPRPNMHVYHPDGRETIINSEGGWKKGMHRGKRLAPLPKDKKVRKAVRKLATKFVKKAGRMIPVVGIVFLLADGAEAAELVQDPCATLGDYVNFVIPYQDVLDLTDMIFDE